MAILKTTNHLRISSGPTLVNLALRMIELTKEELYFKVMLQTKPMEPWVKQFLIKWNIDYPIKYIVLNVVNVKSISISKKLGMRLATMVLDIKIKPDGDVYTVMIENYDELNREGLLYPELIS